ncbi:MAG: hypothetical protein V3V18_13915 [Methylococcales bacterium]
MTNKKIEQIRQYYLDKATVTPSEVSWLICRNDPRKNPPVNYEYIQTLNTITSEFGCGEDTHLDAKKVFDWVANKFSDKILLPEQTIEIKNAFAEYIILRQEASPSYSIKSKDIINELKLYTPENLQMEDRVKLLVWMNIIEERKAKVDNFKSGPHRDIEFLQLNEAINKIKWRLNPHSDKPMGGEDRKRLENLNKLLEQLEETAKSKSIPFDRKKLMCSIEVLHEWLNRKDDRTFNITLSTFRKFWKYSRYECCSPAQANENFFNKIEE